MDSVIVSILVGCFLLAMAPAALIPFLSGEDVERPAGTPAAALPRPRADEAPADDAIRPAA